MIETWCLVIETTVLVLSGIREIKAIKFHGEKVSKISWGKYLSHEIKSIYFHNFYPTRTVFSYRHHTVWTNFAEMSRSERCKIMQYTFSLVIFNLGSFLPKDACKSCRSRLDIFFKRVFSRTLLQTSASTQHLKLPNLILC